MMEVYHKLQDANLTGASVLSQHMELLRTPSLPTARTAHVYWTHCRDSGRLFDWCEDENEVSFVARKSAVAGPNSSICKRLGVYDRFCAILAEGFYGWNIAASLHIIPETLNRGGDTLTPRRACHNYFSNVDDQGRC